MIVTIDDVRRAGHCVSGARRWFALKGLDFRAFLKDGMDADAWRALGDGQADHVLTKKIERDTPHG